MRGRKCSTNYVGNRYGKLLVLEKTNKSKNNRILYKCKCDCGNIVYYNSTDFKHCVSCGCYKNSKDRINKTMESMKYIDKTSIALISKTTTNVNNTAGFRGVSFDKSRNKYRAYIKLRYKNIFLGRFDTLEQAKNARLEAENKFYKPLIEEYNK